jgi:hypothetical protein
MHAVLGRCRQQNITQFDFKCRILYTLVELSCHMALKFGGQMYSGHKLPQLVKLVPCHSRQQCAADRVQTSFLRMMAGAGNGSIEVLLRDFNRSPIMHHWVILAARWFMTLKGMPPDRLAHCAWIADIELMLAGCRECWTYRLSHTMSRLGVIDGPPVFDQTGRVLLTARKVSCNCGCHQEMSRWHYSRH